MNPLLLRILLISVAIVATFTSCDSDPTVQTYYVDSQDKDGFYNVKFPVSVFGINEEKLSAESRKAYESMNRVNVLIVTATDDKKSQVEKEAEKFNKILKNGTYKTLITHSSDDYKVRFVYEGDTDSIDELIAFVSYEDKVMGIGRITGDNMNVGDLMKMMNELEKEDINPANLKGILQGMGMDIDKHMKKNEEIAVDSMNVKDI